ncbi:MAG: hypothetical protein MJZ20_15335, partial [Bacteroidaceae bacterium]|nr:hypothetical protein [Bacteroidaceae bacterium]
MSDLISVSNLLKNSAQIEFTHTDGTVGTYINVEAVKFEQQYNSIDAEPVVHGQWDEERFAFCNVCSNCGLVIDRTSIKMQSGKFNYCPNCGAKM